MTPSSPAQPALQPPLPMAAAERSFDAVYREHAETVARWAMRLGGPGIDWEEVTQEVFVKVHRELPRFRGDAKLTTWLYDMTQNELRNRRRKERLRRLFRAPERESLTVRDSGPNAHELVERQQANARLYRVLEQLHDRYREVLVLFEMEGRSGAEVSALLNMPVERLWVVLRRAREAFAKALARLEAEETHHG